MKILRLAKVILAFGLTLPIMARAETKEYNLVIAKQDVNINGTIAKKITINGTIPGPVLRFSEGDEAVINVTNHMDEDTSVHWHGIITPGNMDGAPGFNGAQPIKPHETFTYRFPIVQSGTYWYHSHTLGQEQDGLYAGLIIDPKDGEKLKYDREYVVLLSDYKVENAKQIQAHLKASSDYYQYHRKTIIDYFNYAKANGLKSATQSSLEWGKMRMLPSDLSDVTGYDFLINGMTPKENWTGLYKKGEKIRLRFINASAMTMYDVRITGLKMTVVQADGQDVEPVTIDEFRFGNAETYDVIVEPQDEKPYTITAEPIDRTGFATGTLATHLGQKGEAPVKRPRASLTMSDMNMEMMMKDNSNMDMSNMTESGWAQTGAPEGAKVLQYSDLRSLNPQPDTRAPTRNIEVRLGGNMERYIWTMNGKVFDPKVGFKVDFNERVRLTYINETMMAHPIHLHGMFVELENGQPADKLPNKHTVIVPPGQTLSVLLSANNPGDWPFHCHLFFHMTSGMMTQISVAQPDANKSPPHEMKTPDMPDMDMKNMPMMHHHMPTNNNDDNKTNKEHDHAH